MKKIFPLLLAFLLFNSAYSQKTENMTFHDFSATTIDGKELSMSEFKGKKILVVNTASECGLTPQYKELQELYDKYKDSNLVIIGFPANDFLSQEPGTDGEIQTFCQKNYGVTFQMMSKISVKGDEIHPIYNWLTDKNLNGVKNSKVKWNFQKYLIDENGNLIEVFDPTTSPLSEDIIKLIEE